MIRKKESLTKGCSIVGQTGHGSFEGVHLYDQGSDIGLMCFKLMVVHKRKSLIINYRLLTKIELFKGEDQTARGPQLCFCKNIFLTWSLNLCESVREMGMVIMLSYWRAPPHPVL